MAELQDSGKRWGQGVVDLGARNLPALKAGHVFRILRTLPADARVLDFGCGEGKILNTIKAHHPSMVLDGIDIQAPLESGSFRFHRIDQGQVDLPEASFDLIICLDVLEHVPDLDQSLRQMAALLKDTGQIALFVPTEGERFSFFAFYRLLLGKDLYLHTKDHHHAYRRQWMVDKVGEYFEIQDRHYSYHLLGSLFDATFFAFCKIDAIYRWFWTSNAIYRPASKKSLGNRLLAFANWICFWESSLLARVPACASGIHLTGRKKT